MNRNGEYLHNKILPKKEGYYVDHINGDRLDNRPENLRYVTPSQNARNCVTTTITGRKLVTIDKSTPNKPYKVQIRNNGKNIHLGRFSDIEIAQLVARTYCEENCLDYTER